MGFNAFKQLYFVSTLEIVRALCDTKRFCNVVDDGGRCARPHEADLQGNPSLHDEQRCGMHQGQPQEVRIRNLNCFCLYLYAVG